METKLATYFIAPLILAAFAAANIPAISYSYEPGGSHYCLSNSIWPLPDPLYYAIGCFNSGIANEGFWVFEVAPDLKSGTFKSFVQTFPVNILTITPDGLSMNSQKGETWIAFSELTFTGSTYTLGTVHDIETDTFQGMTTPPTPVVSGEQTGAPIVIPGTNYGFFGFEYLTTGAIRVSKNGDAMPTFDVLNSLYCSAAAPSLHPNLGTNLVTVSKTIPMKAQLLDYTITGPVPASVSLPMTYPSLNPETGIYLGICTPDIPQGNFAYFGVDYQIAQIKLSDMSLVSTLNLVPQVTVDERVRWII